MTFVPKLRFSANVMNNHLPDVTNNDICQNKYSDICQNKYSENAKSVLVLDQSLKRMIK